MDPRPGPAGVVGEPAGLVGPAAAPRCTIAEAFRTKETMRAAFADAGLTAEIRETTSLFQYAAG
jgi:hypothetical protein